MADTNEKEKRKGSSLQTIKKETLKHKEAFEFYYSLGDVRSYQKVAEEYGVTLKAVAQWSKSFNWQERIAQRDIEIGQQLKEKTMDTIINEKANYRKIVKLAMSQLVESMRAGEMTYRIQDLERLIRLDMYLLGESEANVKVENTHTLSEQDKDMIRELGVSMTGLVDELGEA